MAFLARLVACKIASVLLKTAKRFAGSFVLLKVSLGALERVERERQRERDDTGGAGDKHARQASPCQILRYSGL